MRRTKLTLHASSVAGERLTAWQKIETFLQYFCLDLILKNLSRLVVQEN